MREILFRGQTRKKGEKARLDGTPVESNWVYGGIFQGPNRSVIYGYEPIEKHVVYSETVGQFTGLTDKNGKKIFEGDIVEPVIQSGTYQDFSWGHMEVVFDSGAFSTKDRAGHVTPLTGYSSNVLFILLGNIHDNPELLEDRNGM